MTALVWCDVTFSAAHSLPEFGHAEVHGHSYRVRVFYPEGFSVEELRTACRRVAARLDHKNLDVVMDDDPTMENIASLFGHQAAWNGVLPVKVWVERPVEGLGAEWTW